MTWLVNSLDAEEDKEMRDITGKIENTNERCVMRATGYWVGAKGKHITSYERIDKPETDIHRQYSMDRHHRFWIETEDKIY